MTSLSPTVVCHDISRLAARRVFGLSGLDMHLDTCCDMWLILDTCSDTCLDMCLDKCWRAKDRSMSGMTSVPQRPSVLAREKKELLEQDVEGTKN